MKIKNTFRMRIISSVTILLCAMAVFLWANSYFVEAAGPVPHFVGQTRAFLDPNFILGVSFREDGLIPSYQGYNYYLKTDVTGTYTCSDGVEQSLTTNFGVFQNYMADKKGQVGGTVFLPLSIQSAYVQCPDGAIVSFSPKQYFNIRLIDYVNGITDIPKPDVINLP